MNNKQLAEAFSKGATSGQASNMFIEGAIIYSYGRHFPIARRLDNKRKYLFTTRKYSRSTAKHKAHVYYALITAGVAVQKVDNVIEYRTKRQIIRDVVEALQ